MSLTGTHDNTDTGRRLGKVKETGLEKNAAKSNLGVTSEEELEKGGSTEIRNEAPHKGLGLWGGHYKTMQSRLYKKGVDSSRTQYSQEKSTIDGIGARRLAIKKPRIEASDDGERKGSH